MLADPIYDYWKKNNYVGLSKLWEITKQNNTPISYTALQDFFKNNRTTQLHKKTYKNPKKHIPFVIGNNDFDWQADLLDMSKHSRSNQGYKWILIVIDIFNRKAWARPLKNKTNSEVGSAFNNIIKSNNDTFPKRILTDDGGEFKGVFKKSLAENDVTHRLVNSSDHNLLSPINRFSRLLKEVMYKHFTETNTTNWINSLQEFVDNYNNTPHGGICNVKPNEANQYFMSVRDCFIDKIKNTVEHNKLKVGDIVRTRLKKTVFDKGYERTWSKKTFIITSISGYNYVLDNGETKRESDLQKVNKEDNDESVTQTEKDTSHAKFRRRQQRVDIGSVDEEGNIIIPENLKPKKEKRTAINKEPEYLVEAIVGEKINNGRKYYEVKWAGFPDSENTWEPFKNIKDLEAYDKWLKLKRK